MNANKNGESTARSNPYVGPRFFVKADQDWYYGRNQEANELLALLTARRLVLFYAQSGAGKTSLINARLLPMLEKAQDGFELLPVGRVGDSVDVSVPIKNTFAFNLMVSLGVHIQPEELADLDLADCLLDLAFVDGRWVYAGEGANGPAETSTPESDEGEPEEAQPIKPRALIIDQFEEIFTLHPELEEERIAFFQQLAAAMAADPYLYVMLSMREDYIAQLSPYVNYLPDGLRTRYYMQRMQHEAALEAVSLPAAKGRRPFSPDVPEKLVNYLRRVRTSAPGADGDEARLGPYVEPVQLQVVCYQLWQSLQETPGDIITMADVNQVAKRLAEGQAEADPLAAFIDTALAGYYEQAITAVLSQPDVTVSEYDLRHWFSEVLITSAGIRNLVARGKETTQGMPEMVVRLLDEKHHLVRNDLRGGRPFVELVHDSFVNPIRQANRQWREAQTRNIPWLSAAYQYARTKEPALLLSGDALLLARQQEQTIKGLPDEATAYLKASEDAQREEDLQAAKLRERQRTRLLMGAAIALVIALALAVYGQIQRIRANEQTTIAVTEAANAKVAEAAAAANAVAAVTEAAKAQEARVTADAAAAAQATEAANARNAEATAVAAQADAEIAEDIAKALWLANQSQSYRTSGNTVGGLLLAVEAQKQAAAIATSEADQVEKDVTQNFVHSALLSTLNDYTGSADSGEAVFRANLTDAPFSNGEQYFPVAKSLWVLHNSELVTVTLPEKGIENIAISGDGRSLVFSNDVGEIAWIGTPPIANDLSQPSLELSFRPLPDNQAGSIKALALNQDGQRLAIIRCRPSTTSASTATLTTTPTATPIPGATQREEQVCLLQLWEMDSQGNLARVNQACEPRANDAVSLTFLSGNSRLVWHDQQNLLFVDFQAQQCNPDSIPLPQQPVHKIAYLPGADPTTGFLFTAGNSGDCPACSGWLQWWQIRWENSNVDFSQLGALQQLTSGLTAVQPILEPPAIVTVNQSNQFTWTNTAVADWPAIACGLAGRNLTANEWRTAFPTLSFDTVYAQDEYTNTCALYGLDYGLDISFAREKLNEAAIELRKCNRTAQETAAAMFAQASTYAQESHDTLDSESNFENWGLQILAQHVLEDNAAALGNCINQMVLLYQSNEAGILDRSALQDMIIRLRGVSANIFREEYDHQAALADLQTLTPQITALPSVLQPVFRQKLTNLYSAMCFSINITESCQLLIATADQVARFDQPQRSTTARQPMWRFDGQAGEVVAITMNAEEGRLDPFLRVLDEQGAIIAVNDDSGGSLNSLIIFSVPESGAYFISTTGFGGSSGAYVLTLARNLPAVQVGDTVQRNTATATIWQLALQAGDIISVTVKPADNKTAVYLTLLDANGYYLRDGNRYEAGVPAEIPLFIAPETGIYFIQTAASSDGSGAYELSVGEHETRPLTPNQTESAHTTDSTVWAFEAQVGDVVSITLTMADDNISAFLNLYDRQWNQVGYAEAGYGNRRGNTGRVPLYQAGTYFVEVGTYDSSSGNYDLTFTQDSLPPLSLDIDDESGMGTATSTTLDNLLWQFTGRAGDRVTIDLESPNEFFDPYLTLIAPNGMTLIEDDDSGDGPLSYDARIQDFELPEDGVYFILVGRPDSTELYTLTLRIVSP